MNLKVWHGVLLSALVIAGALAPFASPHPDGLEYVAETLGFAHKGEGKPLVKSPLPDYTVPFLGDGRLTTSLAGMSGALILFALVYGLGKILSRRGETGDR